MILLSDIFEQLEYSEFNNINLSSNFDGITSVNYPKLIVLVNLGLTELYKRFPLKMEEVVVDLQDGVTNYRLHTNHAVTDPNSTDDVLYPKWIADSSSKPFTDTIIKIEQVFDELGAEVPLNDHNKELSVFTPKYDILQVPYAVAGYSMGVIYRASPDKISTSTTDPSSVEILIPPQMTEALVAYIGQKFFSPPSSSNGDSQNYINKFELEIRSLMRLGLFQENENTTNQRVWINGWA